MGAVHAQRHDAAEARKRRRGPGRPTRPAAASRAPSPRGRSPRPPPPAQQCPNHSPERPNCLTHPTMCPEVAYALLEAETSYSTPTRFPSPPSGCTRKTPGGSVARASNPHVFFSRGNVRFRGGVCEGLLNTVVPALA